MRRDLLLVALALATWGIGEGMFLYFEPLYLQELGADPLLIGSILGGVGAAMVVSYLPAGYLSDRFGRRLMLRVAWLIGTAATWVMALSNSLPTFVAGMALYGFTSFVIVPLNSYITHARGSWSVGRTITLVSASFNTGVILGPLIGGWIGNEFGLQRTFLFAAMLFIISTAIIFTISSQPVGDPEDRQGDGGIKAMLTHRYVRYLVLIFFVMLALYLPQPLSQNFLQNERGLNLVQIGQLISMRSIGLVILNLTLGQMNARLGFLWAQLGMAMFSLLIWQGSNMLWYSIGYFLLGSYQTCRSLAIAQGRSLIQTARMGLGYGMIETAMTAAVMIAPPLAGLIYKQDPTWVYPASIILIAIALLVSLLFSPIRSNDIQL